MTKMASLYKFVDHDAAVESCCMLSAKSGFPAVAAAARRRRILSGPAARIIIG